MGDARLLELYARDYADFIQRHGITSDMVNTALVRLEQRSRSGPISQAEILELCKPPQRLAAYHMPRSFDGKCETVLLDYEPAKNRERHSMYVEDLRRAREERERLRSLDDNLDELKRQTAEAIEQKLVEAAGQGDGTQ